MVLRKTMCSVRKFSYKLALTSPRLDENHNLERNKLREVWSVIILPGSKAWGEGSTQTRPRKTYFSCLTKTNVSVLSPFVVYILFFFMLKWIDSVSRNFILLRGEKYLVKKKKKNCSFPFAYGSGVLQTSFVFLTSLRNSSITFNDRIQ